MAHKPENLVVLIVSRRNTCYFEVLDLRDCENPKFSVDLEKGVWRWHDRFSYARCEFAIGSDRHLGRHRGEGDVIGVFDKTDTRQLNIMASAVAKSTRSQSASLI